MGDGARFLSPAFDTTPPLLSHPAARLSTQAYPRAVPYDLFPRVPPPPRPLERSDEEVLVTAAHPSPIFPVTLDHRVNGVHIPVVVTSASLNRPPEYNTPSGVDNEIEERVDDEGNTVFYRLNIQTGMYTFYGMDRPKLRSQAPDNYTVLLTQSDYYLPPPLTSHPSDGPKGVVGHSTPYIPNVTPALTAPLR
jgi:hypothetical protein